MPPPSDAPEGANGEVMPLITIEHTPEEETPKMTDGRVPVGLDILVPQSLEMTNSECSVGTYVAKPVQEGPFSRYASRREHI